MPSNTKLADKNQGLIGENGGIPCVIKAMNTHINHIGIQEAGCCALLNLTINNGNFSSLKFSEMD
jgi:hypothetical protein